jgi:hypothetical protein
MTVRRCVGVGTRRANTTVSVRRDAPVLPATRHDGKRGRTGVRAELDDLYRGRHAG